MLARIAAANQPEKRRKFVKIYIEKLMYLGGEI